MQSGMAAKKDILRKSSISLKAAAISIPWARYWPVRSSLFAFYCLTATGFISKAKSDTIDMVEDLVFSLSI